MKTVQRKSVGGQALVELAVIIILLSMLLFTAMEVGFAFNNFMVATKATYAGAQVGAKGGTDGEIKWAVQQASQDLVATYFFNYGLYDTGVEIFPEEYDRCGSIDAYDTAGRVDRKQVGVRLYYQVGFVVPMSDFVYTTRYPVTSILPMVQACTAYDLNTDTDIIPFAIDDDVVLLYGGEYVFKYGGGAGSNGNYNCLRLGGSGAQVYEENLTNGYNGQLYVGQWVPTEPGNMSGPTNDSVDSRITGHEAHTYDTYRIVDPSCPRVVTFPVCDLDNLHGASEVQILKFANFFLTEVGGNGNDCYVSGKFLGYSG